MPEKGLTITDKPWNGALPSENEGLAITDKKWEGAVPVGGSSVPITDRARNVYNRIISKRRKSQDANGGGGIDIDWLKLALASGGGLIAHSLVSSMLDGKTDEEKRKESIWMRLLSAILPIGAAGLGAWGGYELGKRMKTAQDNSGGTAGGRPGPWNNPITIRLDGEEYPYPKEYTKDLQRAYEGYVPGYLPGSAVDYIMENGSDIQKELAQKAFWARMAAYGSGTGAAATGLMAGYHPIKGMFDSYAQKFVDKTLEAERLAKEPVANAVNSAATEARNAEIAEKEIAKNNIDYLHKRILNSDANRFKSKSPVAVSEADAIARSANRAIAKNEAIIKKPLSPMPEATPVPPIKGPSIVDLKRANNIAEKLAKNPTMRGRLIRSGIWAIPALALTSGTIASGIAANSAENNSKRMSKALESLQQSINAKREQAGAIKNPQQ